MKSFFEEEFIVGSAIAPSLYGSAIRVVTDTQVHEGGEASYPIHEALGWQVVRFGRAARENLSAALFVQEDGSTWQVKLSEPLTDPKGKVRKYETPKGHGSRGYFPPVPQEVRERIAARYGVKIPKNRSFWKWLVYHPKLPIIITEGGKKALSLLSQGYIAIALYGVNGGYRSRDSVGMKVPPTIIPDLAPFIERRKVFLAFDQDKKPSTRSKVALALSRFGAVLEQSGAQVLVCEWESSQKGVDDLIATSGVEAFEASYREAFELSHWRIAQRLKGRLTLSPQARADTRDLSTLEFNELPQSGIVALSSPKGTGKTKCIARLTQDSERSLVATHRIALGRNLAKRLGLDWRGDITKFQGNFINGSAYTLRVGFCVDSLLAINPENFRGCDLIIDEAVQVFRHLLTSSTCSKDGKRPALLARLRELIQAAQRVILADADLDNATVQYVQDLRGEENSEVFLIKNDFQGQGYPVRFLEAPDRSTITGEILSVTYGATRSKPLFVCTDSKGYSKTLSGLLQDQYPDKKILVINSETSGGECEREFIENPDTVLNRCDYDIIIVSPSMATGVSIESQGRILAVYGVFMGVSSTDADMSQALSRVREPVYRVVWCAQVGSRNTDAGRISQSTNPIEFKDALLRSTAHTVRLVRSSLKEDTVGTIGAIDWQADPHITLYCRYATERNYAMQHLRAALFVRLKLEGNRVKIERNETDVSVRALLQIKRHALRELDAESLVAAPDFTQAEVLELQTRETLTPEEQKGIEKFYFLQFYCLSHLTVEDVLRDNEGRRRSEVKNLECLLHPEVAQQKVSQSINKQDSWHKGFVPWDFSQLELKRKLREALGFQELIEKMVAGWEWMAQDLEPIATKIRSLSAEVKALLSFSVHQGVSDVQVVHQLLKQLGLKFSVVRWHCPKGGDRERIYALNREEWEELSTIVDRRWAKFQEAFTPPPEEVIEVGGVNDLSDYELGLLEILEEALEYGQEAVQAIWSETKAWTRCMIFHLLPRDVRRLVA